MKTFIVGLVIALVLGIVPAVVYDMFGVSNAERFADERVQLPELDMDALARGRLAHE